MVDDNDDNILSVVMIKTIRQFPMPFMVKGLSQPKGGKSLLPLLLSQEIQVEIRYCAGNVIVLSY